MAITRIHLCKEEILRMITNRFGVKQKGKEYGMRPEVTLPEAEITWEGSGE